MSKKITMIVAALAAFMAFAVLPAIASASPVLTYPTGTVMPVHSKIRAHNVGNTVMTTSAGNVVCSTAAMTGTLTENTGTHISGDITSAEFTGKESENRCSGPLGATKVTVTSLPWCITTTEETNGFEVYGGNCGETPRVLTFILDASGVECKYSRANVKGTFTTHPEDAILTIKEVEFAKEGGSFLCPGSGKLDMSFTLENDGEKIGEETAYIS